MDSQVPATPPPSEPPTDDSSASTPTMDVVTPKPLPEVATPPKEMPTENSPPPSIPQPLPQPILKPTTKAQSSPANGIGLAIVATVVIVIGLAALAVFAYLKTQK